MPTSTRHCLVKMDYSEVNWWCPYIYVFVCWRVAMAQKVGWAVGRGCQIENENKRNVDRNRHFNCSLISLWLPTHRIFENEESHQIFVRTLALLCPRQHLSMLSHIDFIFITVITVCRKIDFVIKDDLPSVWLNRLNLLCVPGVSNVVRTVTTSQSPQVTQ